MSIQSRVADKFLITAAKPQDYGLFIPLPQDLAVKFSDLGEMDDSPPHITFLYGSHIEDEFRRTEWLGIVAGVFGLIRGSVEVVLQGTVDYFYNPVDNFTVAYTPVRFSHDMSYYRQILRDRLIDADFDVMDAYPLYRPHVTLAYLPGLEARYEGEVPKGRWKFDEMQIWIREEAYKGAESVSFGSKNPRPTTQDLFGHRKLR